MINQRIKLTTQSLSMNKHKKFISLVALLIFFTGASSCNDDSDDPIREFKFTRNATVTGASDSTPAQKEDGVVRIINTDEYTIFVMLYTTQQRLRESGSGFSDSTVVRVNDYVEYELTEDQINYSNRSVRPLVVRTVPYNLKQQYLERKNQ